MSIPFSQAWTVEHTRRWVHAGNKANTPPGEDPAKWRAQQMRVLWDEMRPIVANHLLFLAKQGRLSPIPEDIAPQTRMARAWGKLISGTTDEYDREYLGNAFTNALRKQAMFGADHVDVLHARFLITMERGDLDWSDLQYEDCSLTGKTAFYQLDSWRITPGTLVNHDFVPAEPGTFQMPRPRAIQIPVPSGKLLISDWLSIDGFSEIMKEMQTQDQHGGSVSINSALGCQVRTEDYARVGVAHVCAGDGSSDIIQEGSVLRLGRVEEGHRLEKHSVGSVCQDLWWITMVDRAILLGLLARKHPDPEAVLEQYLATTSDQVTQLDVAPGTWHLYAHGSPELFAEQREFAVDYAGFDQLNCVFSKDPLPRLEQKAAPRPR